ncbi:hypothetical protein [Sphingomonas sp.]|uniref:hypothetical protein n=1 Tax=Sphingomonas sp. TaxID=28214 RepID=UPI000DB1B16A|nr:hypothetical protein [Sphingomonas sp.]PZU08214.1 MAG: hypothetical protein DI605_13300 [Sphingomonas sp.]
MKPFRPVIPSADLAGAPRESAMAPARARRWLVAILGFGLALRLALVAGAGIYHPDELFQYLEQAHRLVFGLGLVPWEYRYGMRGWLLPVLLSGPMALGGMMAPATSLYILLPRACAALLSMTIVWSAWRLGRRISPAGGLIAAGIAAGWAEFVYFAPHILSETISIALILPAAALLTESERSTRLSLIAGFLLGIAILLRMQHLPAAATLALFALRHRPRDWMPLIGGGAIAIAIGGAVDIAHGQAPFGWAIEYVRQNILLDRAATYGTEPAWAYARAIGVAFCWWLAPLLMLAIVGATRAPALLAMALVNLAVHAAIGHKEYRFILLTTATLTLLAALGTAMLVERAIARRAGLARSLPWAAIGIWAIASASLAASGRPGLYAMDAGKDGPNAFAMARADPLLCGLATQGLHFSRGGGYAYLHRATPLFIYDSGEAAALARDASGFNRLIAPASTPAPVGFRQGSCLPARGSAQPLCLFLRSGGCRAIRTANEANRMLVRTDQ